MQNFIKTSDEKLAKELRFSGYTELKRQGKFFVFINNGTKHFSEEEKSKVLYTNKMEV